ncbi:MAG: hypothetical protein CSA04_01740, partial [Bacteroidetes bacterium]
MIFVGVACTDDYENPVSAGVGIQLYPTHCYPLDEGVVGKAYVTNGYVKEIISEELGTVAISDSVGSFTFTKEQLGFTEPGDVLETFFGAYNKENKMCKTAFKFTYKNPLAIDGKPNLPPVEQMDTIRYQLAEDCTPPTSLIITKSVDGGTPEEILNETYTEYDFGEKLLVNPITLEDAGKTFTFQWTFANENGSITATHTVEVKIQTYYDFEGGTPFSLGTYTDWTFEDGDGLPTYG